MSQWSLKIGNEVKRSIECYLPYFYRHAGAAAVRSVGTFPYSVLCHQDVEVCMNVFLFIGFAGHPDGTLAVRVAKVFMSVQSFGKFAFKFA